MIIPNKIRIGDHYYDVRKVTILDWKNSNVVGSINYSLKKIKLKNYEKDKRVIEETLFHEVAHALIKELEYNHPKISAFRSDELFIQEMGLNLRRTFLDLLEGQEDKK